MINSQVEADLRELTNVIVHELISLTPDSVSALQFEIVGAGEDDADFGLIGTDPTATKIVLTPRIGDVIPRYHPLARQYVPNWRRTAIQIERSDEGWKVHVEFGA